MTMTMWNKISPAGIKSGLFPIFYSPLRVLTFKAFHSRRGCFWMSFRNRWSSVKEEGFISPLSRSRFKNSSSESLKGRSAESAWRHSSRRFFPYSSVSFLVRTGL